MEQPAGFERVSPAPAEGLTAGQARLRAEAGAVNETPTGITPTVGRIWARNIFTLFNLINLLLAVAILLVGHPENTLFFGIALCNTLMGAVQELRAKRKLDHLAILARGKAAVVRDGKQQEIARDDVVLDDVLVLETGAQVCADGVLLQNEGLEVDESLLSGEADPVGKAVGDHVLSGSFVVAGRARVQVTAVGAGNYANRLAVEAKREKKQKSQLMGTLNGIIRVLTFVILPLGALLFYQQYTGSGDLSASVLGASAAMIGMIPEGLILLTSVTLTVGALALSRQKALVQTLPSIEMLARADVLCLDKTGTITDGTLRFEEIVLQGEGVGADVARVLGEMMHALPDGNATARALRGEFSYKPPAWRPVHTVPFSSARKWSGAAFEAQGSYVLGAPAFVFPQGGQSFAETARKYTGRGYRVLCLARSSQPFTGDGLPGGLACLALVVLGDSIRKEAPETFRFFAEEGVALKVISGDDALTASTIAGRAGIAGAESYVDMAGMGDDGDFTGLVEEYTVFGRVSPRQKRGLIRALEQNGHTACMTGDGVNDVLAMKEASCSVAMLSGSEAARGACDFVLMTGDFSAMVQVLREGRRVINNIERVASLYLVKTIYSAILALLYIFLPFPYPFAPLQMTPINALTVGIPSFVLALRANYKKPSGRFTSNILENSAPAALCVVLSILVVQLAGYCFGLSAVETSTMNVLLTGAVGFTLLFKVSKPLTGRIWALLAALATAFLFCFFAPGNFFMLEGLFSRNAFFYLPLLYAGPRLFLFLSALAEKAGDKLHAEK